MKTSDLSEFDRYVERRLQAWGHEFAFDRDFELLGHKSKDMLQILVEHKGEMPPRSTGFKPPRPIPPLEWQIEEIVHDIHRDAPMLAIVLRASYCGSGRVGVERFELAKAMGGPISRRGYYVMREAAFHRVAGALATLARDRAA
jgi:hypothetical protein